VRAGRESEGRLGWGGLRLAAELGLAAGVASAFALAVAGPASRLASWSVGGDPGVRLAGSTTEGAASLQLASGFVLGQLPPPFDQPQPTPVPMPSWTPGQVVSIPVPPLPGLPPVRSRTLPTAAPAPAPRRQPLAALGPGSSTRAPLPVRVPVRTPGSTPASTPPPPPPPPRTIQLSGPAAEILAALNRSRAQGGLDALRADASLTQAAIEHAAQIASQGQLSHSGYVTDVNAQGVAWQGLGEVLGADAQGPDSAVVDQLWMQSSEHRPIILDPQYQSVGIGWARSSSGWWYVSAILEY
jgi:uncharacterized protein YkwD